MWLADLIFFKQARAEKRRAKIVHYLQVRGEAISILFRQPGNVAAQVQKEGAEAQLQKLGVF